MKGNVELLSRAMRTIDFEAIFVDFVQFWIDFHSFKLSFSRDINDCLDPYFVIKKMLFDRRKIPSRILESTIAFVRLRYKAFLKFCLS